MSSNYQEMLVYTAEATAFLAALEYREKSECKKWIVATGSISVKHALSNPCHSFETNYRVHDIREKYYNLAVNGWHIILIWTPSYIGVLGNGEAFFLF